MLSIEFADDLKEEISDIVDNEFSKYAVENDLTCNYKSFCFVAKENDEIIGVIEGHSYYKEIYISDLIVLEQYRNKHIGSKLMEAVEKHHKHMGFENINLTTYDFQAPEFYKKCGFEVEFVRKSKSNPKLNKYFLIKYL